MCLAGSQSASSIALQTRQLFRVGISERSETGSCCSSNCNALKLRTILAQRGEFSGALENRQPLVLTVRTSFRLDFLFERIKSICVAHGEFMDQCAEDPCCEDFSLLHIDSKGANALLTAGVPIQ